MSRFGDFLHNLWHLTHPGERCDSGSMTVISDVALQRQMLYDAYGQPETAARIIGLPGISEDGAEMERAAHLERMEALVPIFPLLLGQADFMAHAHTLLTAHNSDADPDEEQLEIMHQTFNTIVRASVVSSVATAVALGVLEINKGVTTDDD